MPEQMSTFIKDKYVYIHKRQTVPFSSRVRSEARSTVNAEKEKSVSISYGTT